MARFIICIILSGIIVLGISHPIRAGAIEMIEPSALEAARSGDDHSFRAGSEPYGLGGLRWGAELAALSGAKHKKTCEIGGSLPDDVWDFDRGTTIEKVNIETYVRPGEVLRIGRATIDSIEYGFWNGKLCEITVTTKGSGNWASLKDAVIEMYGRTRENIFQPGTQSGRSEEYVWYRWSGKMTEMELEYAPADELGHLWMGSTALRNEIFKSMREKTGNLRY